MKVSSQVIEQINQNAPVAERPSVQAAKSLLELAAGDRFTARVLDIKPGSVLLQLADGNSLTAKSFILPDAHIGDKATFLVKEAAAGEKGQILLEMVKPDTGGASASIVKEALGAARMQLTPQNAEIVNMLIRAQMPIDAQTIQRAAFFKYASPELSDKEIIFLTRENFPANEKSVELYKGFADKTLRLSENIEELLRGIEDTALPEDSGGEENLRRASLLNDLKEKIPQLRERLVLNLKRADLKALPKYFAEIEETVAELRAALRESRLPGETARRLDSVADNLRLMESVREQKQFLQIPFFAAESVNQAELHVLNRKRGRAGGENDNNATAVLSLEYGSLGYVEVVVNKTGKSVTLQFKSDAASSVTLLRDNSPDLIDALREKGFGVTQIGFQRTDERFGLPDGIEPDARTDAAGLRRYSFDMRV